MSDIKVNTLKSVDETFSIGVKELEPVPYLSNRNLLINGGFDIWQRGTDDHNPSYWVYYADRWYYIQMLQST